MGDVVDDDGRLAAWGLMRGEDWTRTLVFYADSTKTARRNLTGYTAKAEVRASHMSSTVLLTLTATVDGANGEVALNAAHANTDIDDWTDAVMDVQLTAPGGAIEYVPALPFNVVPTVTR